VDVDVDVVVLVVVVELVGPQLLQVAGHSSWMPSGTQNCSRPLQSALSSTLSIMPSAM
jgi:hypothetical protein